MKAAPDTRRRAIVIGSGFAGMSAATFLAKAGWQVDVFEKHDQPGGRARRFSTEGFTFDMGPSWYWMPDVFDRYFESFGKIRADYYALTRLDPSYSVFFQTERIDIPSDYRRLRVLFESMEPGAALALDKFLEEAYYKYKTGIGKLVFKPGRSFTEFLDADLAKGIFKLDVFTDMKKHIRKYFRDLRIIQILEFPVLFLGALPQNIPALYSLMNYADIKLGTWYPEGGMYAIVRAMYDVAGELGVVFHFNHEVEKLNVSSDDLQAVRSVSINGSEYCADVIISSADYHHTEQHLLKKELQSYSTSYWDKRVMAPSCLLYYVGVNKSIEGLEHHSLFFDTDFDKHGAEIYAAPQWPSDPLFYVSAVSKTDRTSAPAGNENLFFLIPVAAGLENDSNELREQYFDRILTRFEERLKTTVRPHIVFKKSYAVSDFVSDYHAFKGNAYGLANTLRQTAMLKPSIKSKRVRNLYFAGQLTVPGPGVPPALISGEVAAKLIIKEHG